MAGRRKRPKEPIVPFTRVPAAWLGALHDAHVSASEMLVLLALAQHPQRNGLLSRPVADYGNDHDSVDKTGIMSVTGLRKDQVTRALSNLCKKRIITLPNGTTTPILTPKVKGRRGRVAVYKCNLPQSLETGDGTDEKGRQDSRTKEPRKGGSSAPTVKAQQPYHLEKGSGRAKPDPPTTLLR